MLTSALKKLVGSSTEFDSYTLLRLQAKSYRLIKNSVSETLSRHGLSVLDWSLLGILFQKPEGGRFVEISQEMGVEPPFVTELVTVLKKKGFVKIENNPEDRRAKYVLLSKKSTDSIPSIEQEIKNILSQLLDGVSSSEFRGYKTTMEKMLKNLNKHS
ncbi:MAG: MarR family transcriptional regulator [Candidatus Roizmanbacteria bacterium GW2011_GWA2_37_7]|uniref:MarR family transcriptional regulator n=1 Tax=Candidatus Roizmanbacteria bacterium GW2011_GWA2_37_7 TaxID=1618481 RepID=A0A0G0H6K5_9BACT|nr:MAG: MarR family transcriptional regulator [Candidatus Roizmanbacteria bacterium GW2011_GWA2_37_7]